MGICLQGMLASRKRRQSKLQIWRYLEEIIMFLRSIPDKRKKGDFKPPFFYLDNRCVYSKMFSGINVNPTYLPLSGKVVI
jgi:hypothetical protein